LSVLLLLAGLAASGAATAPADLSRINPNLTPEQRKDVHIMTDVVRRSGLNLSANLDDFDGNGELDLKLVVKAGRDTWPADFTHVAGCSLDAEI
jgi:hypothetical protein